MQTIYLAGGCFWGVEHFFDQFAGVRKTTVGYANGPDKPPTYEDVCASSGHAETVKVDYDEDVLDLGALLDYYFLIIDPVSLNRQGNDTGIQYRTGIYYTDEGQLGTIQAVCARVSDEVGSPLAVEVEPLKNFFCAEEYHQKYLEKHPDGYCHIPQRYFTVKDTPADEVETDDDLRARIGETAYQVTQHAATERPFQGAYDSFFEEGLYVDVVSGEPLFSSRDKYDAGCGWPAFTNPVAEDAVSTSTDTSFGILRTEVRSSGAASHLGHVFDDGPVEAGGRRFCINSAALRFVPASGLEAEGLSAYRSLFADDDA